MKTYYIMMDRHGRQFIATHIQTLMYDLGHLPGVRLLYLIHAKAK